MTYDQDDPTRIPPGCLWWSSAVAAALAAAALVIYALSAKGCVP